jgi:hypothetical protein
MGKITRVYYDELDPNVVDVHEAGEFYYHSNLIGVHEMFHEDYEAYETRQFELRNQLIADAIDNKRVDKTIRLATAMLALSSMKNKVVIMADLP